MLSHTIDLFACFVHGLKWSRKLKDVEFLNENTAL